MTAYSTNVFSCVCVRVCVCVCLNQTIFIAVHHFSRTPENEFYTTIKTKSRVRFHDILKHTDFWDLRLSLQIKGEF